MAAAESLQQTIEILTGAIRLRFGLNAWASTDMQDLVEVLSNTKIWNTPRKIDQAAFDRNSDGSFAGWEPTPPFEYHDGYLSVHFATNNYLELQLTPLQEEAIWCWPISYWDQKFNVWQMHCI